MYRSLDADKIVATTQALGRRIRERFPASSLSKVADELLIVAQEAAAVSTWLAKPHLPLRICAWLGILLLIAVVGAAAFSAVSALPGGKWFGSLAELIQGVDAAVNEAVLTGVAIFFLFTIEVRLKRAKALRAIHVLRSMAHIIDMHQLTKDPERAVNRGGDTPSSPRRDLTPFELIRYLDYCSEAVSVISKIGALYVQRFADPVTLSAVNDVEELTNGLSRKIWQKIMILDRIVVPTAGE